MKFLGRGNKNSYINYVRSRDHEVEISAFLLLGAKLNHFTIGFKNAISHEKAGGNPVHQVDERDFI
jgi:hypothetical protein